MADWAIGDIQGCYKELRKLTKKIKFKPGQDRLWLVGDLVNRGPLSLEVLRYVADLGDNAKVVLGNHDLHLLAIHAGVTEARRGDTLEPILSAHDSNQLLDWLQRQPLIAAHEDGHHFMLHAGIAPQWSMADAIKQANKVTKALRSDKAGKYFAHMYGNTPKKWTPKQRGHARRRVVTNILTRMRYCNQDGELAMRHKGPPELASTDFIRPWYDWRPNDESHCLITGHWSALGIRQTPTHVSLDTGCVWGGELTAYNLQTQQFVQVASKQKKASFMKPNPKYRPSKGQSWRAIISKTEKS